MKEFKNIFFLVDLSESSEKIAPYAQALAEKFHSKIYLLFICYLSHGCLIIQSQGIDLIIMGTHGRKGLDKILFGSVSERVIKTSLVPVLMVNPHRVT